MDDAQQRAPRAGDEVRRQVARDALDLVADELDHVPGVPRRAIDGPRDVEHQRAHEPVVGALARRAQAGAGAREQLAARERPVQVVVGAGGERRVGPAPLRGDGQHPRSVEARVGVQRAAEVGRVEAARVAVDDDEVGRLLAQRRQRGLRVGAPRASRARPRAATGGPRARWRRPPALRPGGAGRIQNRAPPDYSAPAQLVRSGLDLRGPAAVGAPQPRPLAGVVAVLVEVPARAAGVPDGVGQRLAQLAVVGLERRGPQLDRAARRRARARRGRR